MAATVAAITPAPTAIRIPTRTPTMATRILTTGRIARFFGIGNRSRHYKYQSNKESWGFLGRGRRRRYYDERTGLEVDRKGRQVIRV
ncbi:hypothetical protein CYLTODRAFT_448666 [Cylindrobasidium torrendii FP15055 ss-10]|uniref:Uncharacterized protein n=1 Tax=Cylindrobasidium torrendii FP15055 ss-10 TaxID=1314674 RepID=A0A0D7BTZ4_9AGAR|nr:hypothetical protein CYLTODRAFT_448666 [Cylindrobasidium torrendii FP15055 ss-10]